MNELARNAWRAHFRACSEEGAEFGADLFTNEFDEVNASPVTPDTNANSSAFDTEVAQTQNDAASEVMKQYQADDKPIELTAAQKIQQSALQTTGQLNATGTGPGPGFFGSTLGHVLLAGAALTGLYFASNIASAVKTVRR